MTGTYDWNPMPHVVDVRCPGCGGRGKFEFAEAVKIARKEDIPFFKKSKTFEYRFFRRREHGTSWHGALFHPSLHGGGVGAITEALPAGYQASDWKHSKYLYRSHGLDLGAVVCGECGHRAKHVLQWPADAWYQIEYRRQTLWAFDLESARALRAFVAADVAAERKPKKHAWSSFLLHVPSHFLGAKARAEVVKRLDRVIEGS